MAYVEIHQKLREDPKVLDLAVVWNCSEAEVIGRLVLFWLWCVDHAETGDLRHLTDVHLARAAGMPHTAGKAFVEAMTQAGFLERQPYFRICKWWKHVARLMKARYKDKPEKWKVIESLYPDSGVTPEPLQSDSSVTPRVTPTKHSIAKHSIAQPSERTPAHARESTPAEQIYGEYPRKVGRNAALKQIEKALEKVPFEDLRAKVREYAFCVSQWPESELQFIPHPRTWFGQGRWDDDPFTWRRHEKTGSRRQCDSAEVAPANAPEGSA